MGTGGWMGMAPHETELAHFARHGFVRIPDALMPEFVARVQTAVQAELQKLGTVSRGQINRRSIDSIVGVELGPRLTEAVDQLLGRGRWRPLRTLGGILLTMPGGSPEEWNIPSEGWHVDNDPSCYLERVDELMLFTFYSSVQPRGGGTLILSGSPELIERFLAEEEGSTAPGSPRWLDRLSNWHPRLAELMGKEALRRGTVEEWMEGGVAVHGVSLRVVELTGEPGEAVLCHPGMLHTGSRNCGSSLRIMRRTNVRRAK
jgi:hypothetical protein